METEEEKPAKKRKKREFQRVNNSLTDGELAQKCRVWCLIMENHMAALSALDPNLNAAYVAAWRSAIEAFEGMATNELMEDYQLERQAELNKARKQFQKKLDDLDYFIGKAFPERKRIREEFGLHKMRTPSARRGVRDVVIGFASVFTIERYEAALLAAGMPAGFKAEYEAALGDYADAEVKHQASLLDSIRATNERIYAYNALYATHRQVLRAAEVVFDGDKIIIDQFR